MWLVPEYTVFPSAACTSFDIQISNSVDTSKKNLSEGTIVFRYIVPVKEQKIARKITMVALIAGVGGAIANSASTPYGSFDGMTIDINDSDWNKAHDYLYIVWKSVKIS